MDSFCPTFAPMAAPGTHNFSSSSRDLLLRFDPTRTGNLAHPASCPTTQLCARSSSMIGQPFRIQKSGFQSSTPWNLKLFSAAVGTSDANTQAEITEKEQVPRLTSNHAALNPSSFEVQSLLMEICDETNIAELELKMASFKLRVRRDVTKLKGSAAPVVPSKPVQQPATVPAPPSSATPDVPASLDALTLGNSTQKLESTSGILEAAFNEGHIFVTSPKVGYFRRSRVVKKKSGRPLCVEGQTVKEGQVVCYVEQLGTQQPVETQNAGEVVKILRHDGDPVGYGDPLIAIRPSFVGIK